MDSALARGAKNEAPTEPALDDFHHRPDIQPAGSSRLNETQLLVIERTVDRLPHSVPNELSDDEVLKLGELAQRLRRILDQLGILGIS